MGFFYHTLQRDTVLYKTAFSTLFLSILFLGCSSQQPPVDAPKIPHSQNDFVPAGGFYYALLQKDKESWKLLAIDDKPTLVRLNTHQEILRIAHDYSNVYPHFEDELKPTKANYYLCQEGSRKKYTPCTTFFNAVPEAQDIGQLIVHANQNAPKYKYISKTKMNKAIHDTKLFEAIEAKKEHYKFALCQEEFHKASSVEDFNTFVKKYTGYERAKEMLTLALKNLEQLKESTPPQDLPKSYRNLHQKSEQQLERENHSLAHKEESSIHTIRQKVELFRKNLRIGTQTNCGKIVAIEGSKAKVAIQNAGNGELWIERQKLFPQGDGCRIVKGRYLPPPSF